MARRVGGGFSGRKREIWGEGWNWEDRDGGSISVGWRPV
jgi:hypothetical protein